MRIALISYRLPVPGQKRGGVDRFAHDLAQGMAERGHEVVIWSYDPRPEGALYEVKRLPASRFAGSGLGFRLTGGYLGNIFCLFPKYDADALIAMGDSLLMPLLGKPLIRVMLGSALGEAFSTLRPWRMLAQLGVYPLELVTALLQGGCVAISENTCRHNPFIRQVIPIGVDLGRYTPAPAAKTRHPSLVFVGNLGGRKRGALLLRWFEKHVQHRFPKATLAMVSKPGPQLPGVTYYTGIGEAELVRLYQQSWLYASPSRYEGFGLPYLEAMACGTPVIATPNPGSRELLGASEFGCLADDAEFPQTICRLLQHAGEREELAAQGLRRARQYSREVMLDQYEQLLRNLLERRAPAGEVA